MSAPRITPYLCDEQAEEAEALGLPYETGTLLEQVQDSDAVEWAEILEQITRNRGFKP